MNGTVTVTLTLRGDDKTQDQSGKLPCLFSTGRRSEWQGGVPSGLNLRQSRTTCRRPRFRRQSPDGSLSSTAGRACLAEQRAGGSLGAEPWEAEWP